MFNIDIIVTSVIGVLTAIISSWTTWFFTRKKYNSEVDNQMIINMQESLEFYKNLSDDNKNRLEDLLLQNAEILELNNNLIKKNIELESQVKELTYKLDNLIFLSCIDLSCVKRRLAMVQELKENNNGRNKINTQKNSKEE